MDEDGLRQEESLISQTRNNILFLEGIDEESKIILKKAPKKAL